MDSKPLFTDMSLTNTVPITTDKKQLNLNLQSIFPSRLDSWTINNMSHTPKNVSQTNESFHKQPYQPPTELERLRAINYQLVRENEFLKKEADKEGKEKDYQMKVAIMLAENEKLNQVIEDLCNAYNNVKSANPEQAKASLRRLDTIFKGIEGKVPNVDESTLNNTSSQAEPKIFDMMKSVFGDPVNNEKDRKILKLQDHVEALLKENQRLNDILDEKIKEENQKNTTSPRFTLFPRGTIFEPAQKETDKNVQALLGENEKLNNLLNAKNKEIEELKNALKKQSLSHAVIQLPLVENELRNKEVQLVLARTQVAALSQQNVDLQKALEESAQNPSTGLPVRLSKAVNELKDEVSTIDSTDKTLLDTRKFLEDMLNKRRKEIELLQGNISDINNMKSALAQQKIKALNAKQQIDKYRTSNGLPSEEPKPLKLSLPGQLDKDSELEALRLENLKLREELARLKSQDAQPEEGGQDDEVSQEEEKDEVVVAENSEGENTPNSNSRNGSSTPRAASLFKTLTVLTKKMMQAKMAVMMRKLEEERKLEDERRLSEEQRIRRENFTGKFDVVFCIDCTNSMGPYIISAKQACQTIINTMNEVSYFKPDLRFGFVGYRDHPPYDGNTWVTLVEDLVEPELCMQFIDGVTAVSGKGNDIPEAVLPGLWECVTKINWRDNSNEKIIRVVFHIGDAPPHGKKYYSGRDDAYPQGDPSGITIEQIGAKFWELDISYRLLKIGKLLDKMEKDFSRSIKDMFTVELKKAEDLKKLTSSLIETQLEILNNQPSVKDRVFFNKKLPLKKVQRTEKAGQCFYTSVIFDDYYERFVDRDISKEPAVTSLNIYYNEEDIVGVQCNYKTTRINVEGPAHKATVPPTSQITLDFDENTFLDEVVGYLDESGSICGIKLTNSKGKTFEAGNRGVKATENLIPEKGAKLHGMGGSYRKSGVDSLYFYFSYPLK